MAVDTDSIFHELFRNHPDWLRELTGLPLPLGCRGSSRVLKQLEIRCDLLLEPSDAGDPFYLVEFQLYHDHSIFNRIELARQMLWKHLNSREDSRRRDFHPREVETVILFGSRSELPSTAGRYASIRKLFLDELVEALEARNPGSPLAAALFPLNCPLPELEKDAGTHYHRIQEDGALAREDREVLTEIFYNLLLQRFKNKSRKEIRAMIAELTPIHETRVGQELLDEGRKEGRKEGVASLIRRMAAKGRKPAEIAEWTDLPLEEIQRFLDAAGE
jgi:predicted transposase YdaD